MKWISELIGKFFQKPDLSLKNFSRATKKRIGMTSLDWRYWPNLLWQILWISFTMVTLYLSSFASVVRALNVLGTYMFPFSLITYTVVEQIWWCMTKRIQTSSQPTSFPSSHLFLERTLRPRLGANGHRCYRCWCNKRKRRKSYREVLTSSTQRENM